MRFSLLDRFQGALVGAGLGHGAGFRTLMENWSGAGELSARREEPWILEAVIPLSLFHHEDWGRLGQAVTEQLEPTHPHLLGSAQALAFTFHLILTERFSPVDLWTRLPAILNPPGWWETLLTCQTASLEATLTHLRALGLSPGDRVTALGLYCFLCTPNHPPLALGRARQTGEQSEVTVTLTGALGGAYNGGLSLPGWYLETNLPLKRAAANLLAHWAGVYHLPCREVYPKLGVSAPGLMRPGSG